MPLFKTAAGILHFIHVPKCAGTSVTDYLTRRFGTPAFYDPRFLHRRARDRWSHTSPQHLGLDGIDQLFPAGFLEHSFAIIRHPARRILSVFRHQRVAGTIAPQTEFLDWLRSVPALLENDPWIYDGHLRPMSDHVASGTPAFRLEDGFSPILEWIDRTIGVSEIAYSIDHLNRRSDDYRNETSLLDRAELALVEEIYATDYECFLYPSEIGGICWALTDHQGSARELYQRALKLFRANDLSGASRLLQRVVRLAPDNALAHANLSALLLQSGSIEEARNHALRAIDINSKVADSVGYEIEDAYQVITRLSIFSNELIEARKFLSEARVYFPHSQGLLLQEINLLYAEGKPEEALMFCADAVMEHLGWSEARDVFKKICKEFQREDQSKFFQFCEDLGLNVHNFIITVPSQAPSMMTETQTAIVVLADNAERATTILSSIAFFDISLNMPIWLLIPDVSLGFEAPTALSGQIRLIPYNSDPSSALKMVSDSLEERDVVLIVGPVKLSDGWQTKLAQILLTTDLDAVAPMPILTEMSAVAPSGSDLSHLVSAPDAPPLRLPMLDGPVVLFRFSALRATLDDLEAPIQSTALLIRTLSLAMISKGRRLGVAVNTILVAPEPTKEATSDAILCETFGALPYFLAEHLYSSALRAQMLLVGFVALPQDL